MAELGFRLDVQTLGFSYCIRPGPRWACPGPFSWQKVIILSAVLIDLEEISLICPHDVNEFVSFSQSFLLDFVFHAHSAIVCTWGLYFSVLHRRWQTIITLSLSSGNLQIGKLKLRRSTLLSNLLWNLCYFSSSVLLVTNMSILYNSRITKKF